MIFLTTRDHGIAISLMKSLTRERLPRAMEMKQRVDLGEQLEVHELDYLREVFHDFREHWGLLQRHPEYQKIFAQAVGLFHGIVIKALQNEIGKL